MAKIIHEQKKCIGCGSCAAVCSDFWTMEDNGKAKLKGAKEVGDGIFELEVDNIACNKEAASVCPVQCIKVK